MRLAILLICPIGFVASCVILVVAMTFGLVPSPMRTLTFPEQNCSCQIPYVWTIMEQHVALVRAHRLFGGSFSLSAKKETTAIDLTSSTFADGVIRHLKEDGFKIVEQDTNPFQDHPAFSYTMERTTGAKDVYEHVTTFAAGIMLYTIFIVKTGEEPTQDAQLVAAVNSFTLLNPQ